MPYSFYSDATSSSNGLQNENYEIISKNELFNRIDAHNSTNNLIDQNYNNSKSKRVRTAFTCHQLLELEKEYKHNEYLNRPRQIEISQRLSLSERQVKVWFQNRRTKTKKQIENKKTAKFSNFSLLNTDPSTNHQMNIENMISNNGIHIDFTLQETDIDGEHKKLVQRLLSYSRPSSSVQINPNVIKDKQINQIIKPENTNYYCEEINNVIQDLIPQKTVPQQKHESHNNRIFPSTLPKSKIETENPFEKLHSLDEIDKILAEQENILSFKERITPLPLDDSIGEFIDYVLKEENKCVSESAHSQNYISQSNDMISNKENTVIPLTIQEAEMTTVLMKELEPIIDGGKIDYFNNRNGVQNTMSNKNLHCGFRFAQTPSMNISWGQKPNNHYYPRN